MLFCIIALLSLRGQERLKHPTLDKFGLLVGGDLSSRTENFEVRCDSDEPLIIDEFADLFCTDPLRTRIDNYFAEISTRPGSTGLVLWSTDVNIPGRAERYVELIRNHVRFRNFPDTRVRFLKDVPGDSTRFRFYIVPEGTSDLEPKAARQDTEFKISTLFESSRIAVIKNGEVEFGEFDESVEPCDLGLNLGQYSAALSSPDLTAYLVAAARNQREQKKVLDALRLTADALVKSHNFPRSRIQTVYAGVRRESAMQLWIVPKGGKIPTYRRGTLP